MFVAQSWVKEEGQITTTRWFSGVPVITDQHTYMLTAVHERMYTLAHAAHVSIDTHAEQSA